MLAEEEDDTLDLPGDEPKTKPAPEPKKKAPVAVEEPEPVAQKKQVQPHPQRLVDAALYYGFSQADIDSTPSAELRQDIQIIQAATAGNTPKPAEPKTPTPEPVDEDDAYLDSIAANPEVDPKYVKLLRNLKSKAEAKDVREKIAKIDQLEQAQVSRTNRDNTDMVEGAMAALPKRFEKIIGTEAYGDMPEGAEKQRKFAIYQMAKIDFAKDSKRSIEKKIAAAAATLYPGAEEEDEPEVGGSTFDTPPKKKAPPKDPESGRFTSDDFEKGHVAKPSGRKTVGATSLNGPQAVRRWKIDSGFASEADDGESDDLPGE